MNAPFAPFAPSTQSAPASKQQTAQKIDPAFDAAMNELIDAVLEEEKKEFRPGIESFEIHANRIRQEIRESVLNFQKKLKKGYDAICTWLAQQGIQNTKVSSEALGCINDAALFTQALDEGKMPYEVLGFSDEQLSDFYTAAYQFAQLGEFEKGRDAFFFLTTIKADVFEYWLGLAICCTKLQEHEQALEATLQAIELNPMQQESYLNAVYLYLQAHEPEKALDLCTQALHVAANHECEPWSCELATAIESAQENIKLSYHT